MSTNTIPIDPSKLRGFCGGVTYIDPPQDCPREILEPLLDIMCETFLEIRQPDCDPEHARQLANEAHNIPDIIGNFDPCKLTWLLSNYHGDKPSWSRLREAAQAYPQSREARPVHGRASDGETNEQNAVGCQMCAGLRPGIAPWFAWLLSVVSTFRPHHSPIPTPSRPGIGSGLRFEKILSIERSSVSVKFDCLVDRHGFPVPVFEAYAAPSAPSAR